MPALDQLDDAATGHRISRITSIKDIARLAKVSHSTVSRALHGSSQVSAGTAARIRRIAEKAGYRASAAARSLVMGHSNTIGVVVTNIADPFVAGVVGGIEDMAEKHGYSVFLANSNAEPEREVRVVRSFEERRVDGIIVTSSRVGALYMPLMEHLRIPVVLLNNQHPSEFAHSVLIDNVEASLQATRHLIQLGHRRIAYLGDRLGHQSDTERCAGYRRALEEAGLKFEPALVVHGDGMPEGGAQAMAQLLGQLKRPTAVFCYNDMSALGAMRQIRTHRLKVPDDISVAGFDDLYISQYLEPPLTTVRQPMRQMGRMAMETLLHIFDGPYSTHNLRVEGQLIVRQSTARPKENR
ncbi:MAG TPA: LacI family DNA-binding transcriptional regulator [Candidatus Acidoferrales bacterium]|nr:LacI family DNA-binding transcriptional regulator [Candidatus Acidoferrales bacterium]